MSTIDALNRTSATQASSEASAAAAAARTTIDESEDRFLKLLITQMRNQDPLNPLDNAQVTTQLAQINTARGIEKLSTTLNALLEAFGGAQAFQAASLVGREVLVPGTTLQLNNGRAPAALELKQAADSVVVTIKDATGRALHSTELGAHSAGVVQLEWDGVTDAGAAAAPGVYQFSVEAKAGGSAVQADTLSVGRVESIAPTDKGFNVVTAGLGTFSMQQIRSIQ